MNSDWPALMFHGRERPCACTLWKAECSSRAALQFRVRKKNLGLVLFKA